MKQGSADIDVLANVVKAVTDWATIQTTIRGLVLVGSHARGEACADSDIDFIIPGWIRSTGLNWGCVSRNGRMKFTGSLGRGEFACIPRAKLNLPSPHPPGPR
jgi:hypothetical protein